MSDTTTNPTIPGPTVPGAQPSTNFTPRCPNCGGSDTAISDAGNNAICNECGQNWTYQPAQEMTRLSAHARDALADSDFALPGRRFPIHNESHARNALARASELHAKGKLSAEQVGTIKRSVKARYPHIDVDGTKKMSLKVESAEDGTFYMSLVGGDTHEPQPSDLFDAAGNPLPTHLLGLPCTYCWKDASSAGRWTTGAGKPFHVDAAREDHWLSTFTRMDEKGIRIPVVDDHSELAKDGNGRVVKMRRSGDRVEMLVQLVGPEAVRKMASNDVSVAVSPTLITAGETFVDAIRHLAITPVPANPGLNDPVLAASRAAAGTPAPGPTAPPTPAANPSETANMANRMLECSEACMSGLHSLVPGLADAPDSEKLARIHQHLIGRSERDAKDSGEDTKTMSRADVIKKADERRDAALAAVAKLAEKEQQITALRSEVQTMSQSVVKPLDADTHSLVRGAIETKKAGCIGERTGISEATANSLLTTLIGTAEKPNWLGMSRQANPLGTTALAAAIFDVLATNVIPPAAGKEIGTQNMSRVVPGAEPKADKPVDKFKQLIESSGATVM